MTVTAILHPGEAESVEDAEKALPWYMVAGGCVAGILVLVLAFLIVLLFILRMRKRSKSTTRSNRWDSLINHSIKQVGFCIYHSIKLVRFPY